MSDHPWLHIYAQGSWHGEALIAGNRAALSELRNAIDRALQSGKDEFSHAIAGDGEGYSVQIKIRSREALAAAALPYTDDYAQDKSGRQWP